MNDPFNTKSVNRQLMREAKIGLAVVLLLGSFFVYVGYFRMGRFRTQLPDHIIAAPVATNVGQQYYKNFLPDEPSQSAQDMAAGLRNRVRKQRVQPETVTGNRQAAKKSVPSNPFQLPHALRQVGNRLTTAFSRSDQGNAEPADLRANSSLAPALPVADETAGQGPIPAAILKSKNPNQQTEFDIASSGPGGKPEPFSASDLKSKDDPGKLPELSAPTPTTKPAGPEARTAREIPVNERDQSRVVPASGVPSSGYPVSLAAASPFDPAAGQSMIAKTETANQPPGNSVGIPTPAAKTSEEQPLSQLSKKSPAPEAFHPAVTSQASSQTTSLEEFEKHVVQEGEGYWSMAQMYLKDGRWFRALFEHNKKQHANYDDLPTGTQVEIPPSDYLVRHYPDHVPSDLKVASSPGDRNQPGSWYTTRSGETLFDIAKQKYGQASRYLDILNANRDLLPKDAQHMTRLPAGLRLLLPN